jgi:exonuclease III
LSTYKGEWGSGFLASCTPQVRAQAGVAILFRKGLAINFIGEGGKDKNGRVVWALVEINTKVLLIIGVYAPSQGDNPVGGDWNLGMDESLDYYGYANTDPVRPKSRLELHKQIEHYDLLDIYRELHPTPSSGDKTWRAWNKARRKAEKEARLDYFIVDTGLASFVQLVGAAAPFTSKFDHRPVLLNVDFKNDRPGDDGTLRSV